MWTATDVEGVCRFVATDDHGQAIDGPCVAVLGLVHGNEPVGGAVIDRLLRTNAAGLSAGSLLVVRANLDAERLGMRQTPDGVNMNRLWDTDNLARIAALSPEDRCSEEARVHVLAPLISACDAVLDLHSTSRPAPPFLLLRDDRRHRIVGGTLGVERLITGLHEGGILPGGLAANVGLRVGERSDRLGFVFEAGDHASPGNEGRAFSVLTRLLWALKMWWTEPAPASSRPVMFEVVERFVQAEVGEDPWVFSLRGTAGARLESFQEVEADDVLVRRGGDRVLRAGSPFTLLMPAPTAPPGDDLFFKMQRREGGLGDEAVTPVAAKSIARAVERMLDLLDDDAVGRGNTWVSFDSDRILDRCADMVGRVIRLPMGHPHRRLAVVGRGDWGGDATERRRGHRYRGAMRRALTRGVAIDRYQLMRGASIGWIDAMTSDRTASRYARSDADGAVRMILSTTRHHTVSVLVCGDLDAAVAGEASGHVHVALVVAAMAAMPSGDRLRARLVRSAIFSSRPEILMAAHAFLAAIREDHAALMRSAPLAKSGGPCTLVAEDGLLHLSDDPEHLGALRVALRRLQLATWLDALHPHLAVGHTVPRAKLGECLARLMSATGIRDADSLRALLVREEGAQWRVDLDGLRQAVEAPATLAEVAAEPRGLLREPLLAEDVDQDSVERWAAWKRRVHALQIIPDTRGKDVDLPLSAGAIRAQVLRFYGVAQSLAAQHPGRVMVIVAGDGHSPSRDGLRAGSEVMAAHRAVLRDQNVRYLRIQHAEASHMGWVKDVHQQLATRPSGAAPVAIRWEHEHGGTVNVLMIATALEDADEASLATLDGWHIEACGVLVSRLEEAAGDYAVGLFTSAFEDDSRRVNADLLHFGRAHCEVLLAGEPIVWVSSSDDLVPAVHDTLVGWVEDGRIVGAARGSVRRRLADQSLAGAVVDGAASAEPAEDVARRIWGNVAPWPGPEWTRLPASQ